MTLTAEQSSNKAMYEAAPTAEIIDIIRTAMGEGCIRPCHVFDAVDELICRIQALENRPPRQCNVGTAEEQVRRFRDFCAGNSIRINGLLCCKQTCPYIGCSDKFLCHTIWSQMPYEGEAK